MPEPSGRHPVLEALHRREREEQAAYDAALAALDQAAREAAAPEASAAARAALDELNAGFDTAEAPTGRGLGSALAGRAFAALQPTLERQARFNGALVRLLNAQFEQQAEVNRKQGELLAAIVSYAQRVEPTMDARDAARLAETPTETETLLRAFEQQIDALGHRVSGLLALRQRVEILSEQLRALLERPAPAEVAIRAAEDAVYTAFENCFRGSRESVLARQADYAELFRGQEPVVDLGCGRGEFLQALRERGIAARGVEGNANAARECAAKGLDVVQRDLVDYLRGQPDGSIGGIFAAQVVEHLPPPALTALLAEAHRTLRKGGVLLLETVNAASALAFLDIFIRDLTHERPLHPDTLRFLAAAAGFSEARVEWRSPVPDDVKLSLAPSGTLAPPVAQVFNENVARLNALLFAPLDYALIARR